MTITEFSFVMALLWCSFLLLIGAVLTQSNKFVLRYGISGFLIIMIAGVVRLLIPVEFNFTKVIGDNIVMPSIQRAIRVEVMNIFDNSITLGEVILTLWFVGTAVFLVVYFINIARQNRAVQMMSSERCEQYERILNELILKTSPNRKYRLIVSEDIATPMMNGLFIPTILMPKISLTDSQAEFVLSHEWYHFLRGDLWKKFLFNILCAFLWWNPLMYIIKNRLNYILEINCDSHVVEGRGDADRIGYVETTLSVIRQITITHKDTSPLTVAFAECASSSRIVQRCELILYPPKKPKFWTKMLSEFFLIALLVFSYVYIVQPVTKKPPMESDDSIYFEITPENAWLVDNADGTFEFYYNDMPLGTITANDLNTLPYSELEIK